MPIRSWTLIVAVALGALASPVSSLADTGPRPVVAVVTGEPEFSTLAKALAAAGLEGALAGDSPVTLLAPTDAAFAKLPPGTLDELLQPENRERLVALLQNHVVAGRLTLDELKTRREIATLGGGKLEVRLERGNLRIGAARAAHRERAAANGRVLQLDTVLLP